MRSVQVILLLAAYLPFILGSPTHAHRDAAGLRAKHVPRKSCIRKAKSIDQSVAAFAKPEEDSTNIEIPSQDQSDDTSKTWGEHHWGGMKAYDGGNDDASTQAEMTPTETIQSSTMTLTVTSTDQPKTVETEALETVTQPVEEPKTSEKKEQPSSTKESQPSPTTSSGGGGNRSEGDSSGDDAKAMVQLHNDFRARYGAGAVTWNDELASFASDYAGKCAFKHSGGPYGENLAAGSGGYTISSGFEAWANEAGDYVSDQASHFTQVVWKDTKEIGCAIISCPDGTIFHGFGETQYVICEYQPRGNMGGAYAANVQA